MHRPYAALPWAASRSAVSPLQWRPASEWRSWIGYPIRSATVLESHPWLSTQRFPDGRRIEAYDTAVNQVFAQVQAAVNASVGLKSVPSNMTPSLADTPARKMRCTSTVACERLSKAGNLNARWAMPRSNTTVALIGDSISAMMIPAFQQVAEQRHWRLEPMGKGACSVIESPVSGLVRRLVEYVDHCEQWRTEIIARLHAEHPRLVVVSMWRGYGTYESLSGLRSYDPAWLDGLTRLVRDLRGTGTKVLVLGPVPDPRFVVPLCLSANLDDVTACTLRRATSVNESGIAAESAATTAGGGNTATSPTCFAPPSSARSSSATRWPTWTRPTPRSNTPAS